ncbi:unnamed protein product [Didymodactylos carnosus]|uniref:Uncharacterized protein n=1 Tax=Didymodactylos carnosus TaxID=1234261 RepID=A0A8S2M389_9BILA|nr:unnamed protein product [Didymodactylos carnosus]CAF3936135.1 unnamed protein product [Didymodactylos carnosus]
MMRYSKVFFALCLILICSTIQAGGNVDENKDDTEHDHSEHDHEDSDSDEELNGHEGDVVFEGDDDDFSEEDDDHDTDDHDGSELR